MSREITPAEFLQTMRMYQSSSDENTCLNCILRRSKTNPCEYEPGGQAVCFCEIITDAAKEFRVTTAK